jgi:DNA-binding response OmpR family regulator
VPVILLCDHTQLRRDLNTALTAAGFSPAVADRRPSDPSALRLSRPDQAALVVLDLGAEPGDGLDWCRAARLALPGMLICAVTRGPDPVLEVTALEQGADAVISAPLEPRRLAAQLVALMRPLAAMGVATAPDADLTLDGSRRRAVMAGRLLALTDGEFELLAVLHRHRGRVVSRDELSQALHGRPCDAGDRSLDLRVARLRRKLGDDTRAPRWIRSVRGEGYLLLPPDA